jgi:AcrR family transcriptional regulator
MPVPGQDNESARDRLVNTAVILFAEYGTHGISLREITRQADIRNEAAVRYYFKNKEGLLDACMARCAELLDPLQEEAIQTLRGMEAEHPLTIRNVVMAEFYPMAMLFDSSDFGASCIRFLARMIREEHEAGQRILIKHFMRRIMEIETYLRHLMPHKTPHKIRFHHFLAINSMLNGLADKELLKVLPAVTTQEDNFTLSPEQMVEGFVEYLVAGVQA